MKLNCAVALVFFIRPEQLRVVFEEVRKAAPSKLFLIQDGARNNNRTDTAKIQECRKIVENIDWECEVYRNYSAENLGCGRRIYTGIKWAFENVDRLIILEDDCVPSQSFFPFCDELLERYKNDYRVGMISGMNHLEEYQETEADYFFANVGSIAGWATWKRCWDNVNYNLDIYENKYDRALIGAMSRYGPERYSNFSAECEKRRKILQSGGKLSSWSFQFGLGYSLQNQIVLVPKYNLMANIGAAEGATNSATTMKVVPRAIRKIYNLKLYDLAFPIQHPKYIVPDYKYDYLVTKMMHPKGLRAFGRKVESIALKVYHGDYKGLWNSLRRKIWR